MDVKRGQYFSLHHLQNKNVCPFNHMLADWKNALIAGLDSEIEIMI